jgi:hypothetical protein
LPAHVRKRLTRNAFSERTWAQIVTQSAATPPDITAQIERRDPALNSDISQEIVGDILDMR